MTVKELRELLARATRDPESLTAKQRGPYSDVTISGADLDAMLDVVEAAKACQYLDNEPMELVAPRLAYLRDALAKLEGAGK